MKYRISSVMAISIAIALTGCKSASNDNNDSNTLPVMPDGRWTFGDMHVHSTASDGHNIITGVLDRGFERYGGDFIVTTDHSGFNAYEINDALTRLAVSGEEILNPTPNEELHSHDYAKEYYEDDKVGGHRRHNISMVYEKIVEYREKLPEGKYLFKGMEWTIPYTDEHATLFILDQDGNVDMLADFHDEYAKGGGNSKELEHSLNAVRELEEHDNAVFAFNHPSRKHKVTIGDIRHFHNAAPNAMIGMEGAPGHQRNPWARGSYAEIEPIVIPEYEDEYGIAYNGQTYGGFDYMTTRIGGVWDALLSEGRQFSVLSQSDFHSFIKDFWPNQYSKTHVYLQEESGEGLVDALKSGTMYVTHGDIISNLHFAATGAGNTAWMGNTLSVDAGTDVELTIRFDIPELNHSGQEPDVAFVDVIGGEVTGYVNEQDPDFEKPFTDTTRILKSFEKGDAVWNKEGRTVTLRMTLDSVESDMYVRLRGSNNEKGTPGYVDDQGNPVLDLEKFDDQGNPIANANMQARFSSPEELAWSDLWFYANPIYIQVK
ncbi:hypothetical protein [Vibrio superstes]|uniref:Polymerase/histidinol phosphatase N-terminal domain-containing protein n=1 Tax=Vibrio superstes NBRC 103154 TaxID=1219062 RepID=A0A511QVW8_9VIBR|nr:hypothetical protein [Vibrio superstes]GEM81518.1 hypothetical protein VSU01S_37630 [Vibrio superstes NBRC 103154]